jgi:hypothetical protein
VSIEAFVLSTTDKFRLTPPRLYDLVAEDQAIGDTIYALTKAHDNGNIPMASFIKVSVLSA